MEPRSPSTLVRPLLALAIAFAAVPSVASAKTLGATLTMQITIETGWASPDR